MRVFLLLYFFNLACGLLYKQSSLSQVGVRKEIDWYNLQFGVCEELGRLLFSEYDLRESCNTHKTGSAAEDFGGDGSVRLTSKLRRGEKTDLDISIYIGPPAGVDEETWSQLVYHRFHDEFIQLMSSDDRPSFHVRHLSSRENHFGTHTEIFQSWIQTYTQSNLPKKIVFTLTPPSDNRYSSYDVCLFLTNEDYQANKQWNENQEAALVSVWDSLSNGLDVSHDVLLEVFKFVKFDLFPKHMYKMSSMVKLIPTLSALQSLVEVRQFFHCNGFDYYQEVVSLYFGKELAEVRDGEVNGMLVHVLNAWVGLYLRNVFREQPGYSYMSSFFKHYSNTIYDLMPQAVIRFQPKDEFSDERGAFARFLGEVRLTEFGQQHVFQPIYGFLPRANGRGLIDVFAIADHPSIHDNIQSTFDFLEDFAVKMWTRQQQQAVQHLQHTSSEQENKYQAPPCVPIESQAVQELPKPKPKAERKGWECEKCTALNSDRFNMCGECGYPKVEEWQVQGKGEVNADDFTWACAKCTYVNSIDLPHCHMCKTPREEPTSPISATSAEEAQVSEEEDAPPPSSEEQVISPVSKPKKKKKKKKANTPPPVTDLDEIDQIIESEQRQKQVCHNFATLCSDFLDEFLKWVTIKTEVKQKKKPKEILLHFGSPLAKVQKKFEKVIEHSPAKCEHCRQVHEIYTFEDISRRMLSKRLTTGDETFRENLKRRGKWYAWVQRILSNVHKLRYQSEDVKYFSMAEELQIDGEKYQEVIDGMANLADYLSFFTQYGPSEVDIGMSLMTTDDKLDIAKQHITTVRKSIHYDYEHYAMTPVAIDLAKWLEDNHENENVLETHRLLMDAGQFDKKAWSRMMDFFLSSNNCMARLHKIWSVSRKATLDPLMKFPHLPVISDVWPKVDLQKGIAQRKSFKKLIQLVDRREADAQKKKDNEVVERVCFEKKCIQGLFDLILTQLPDVYPESEHDQALKKKTKGELVYLTAPGDKNGYFKGCDSVPGEKSVKNRFTVERRCELEKEKECQENRICEIESQLWEMSQKPTAERESVNDYARHLLEEAGSAQDTLSAVEATLSKLEAKRKSRKQSCVFLDGQAKRDLELQHLEDIRDELTMLSTKAEIEDEEYLKQREIRRQERRDKRLEEIIARDSPVDLSPKAKNIIQQVNDDKAVLDSASEQLFVVKQKRAELEDQRVQFEISRMNQKLNEKWQAQEKQNNFGDVELQIGSIEEKQARQEASKELNSFNTQLEQTQSHKHCAPIDIPRSDRLPPPSPDSEFSSYSDSPLLSSSSMSATPDWMDLNSNDSESSTTKKNRRKRRSKKKRNCGECMRLADDFLTDLFKWATFQPSTKLGTSNANIKLYRIVTKHFYSHLEDVREKYETWWKHIGQSEHVNAHSSFTVADVIRLKDSKLAKVHTWDISVADQEIWEQYSDKIFLGASSLIDYITPKIIAGFSINSEEEKMVIQGLITLANDCLDTVFHLGGPQPRDEHELQNFRLYLFQQYITVYPQMDLDQVQQLGTVTAALAEKEKQLSTAAHTCLNQVAELIGQSATGDIESQLTKLPNGNLGRVLSFNRQTGKLGECTQAQAKFAIEKKEEGGLQPIMEMTIQTDELPKAFAPITEEESAGIEPVELKDILSAKEFAEFTQQLCETPWSDLSKHVSKRSTKDGQTTPCLVPDVGSSDEMLSSA